MISDNIAGFSANSSRKTVGDILLMFARCLPNVQKFSQNREFFGQPRTLHDYWLYAKKDGEKPDFTWLFTVFIVY